MTSDADRTMMELFKQMLPCLRTQAQLTAFMLAFDSFRTVCEGLMQKDKAKESEARDLLEKGFKTIGMATEVSEKLEEIPEESRSKISNSFVSPPLEFHEYDVQKKLLFDLNKVNTLDSLKEWYSSTRSERDRVVSQSLRNILMDAIREKKATLQKQE